eukprot:scaffold5882_cov100-Cylindrotheca_fusiformis.AAC.5
MLPVLFCCWNLYVASWVYEENETTTLPSVFLGSFGISKTIASSKGAEKRITVDVLSIGSKHRPDFQRRQIETFGSHRTVRNFFVVDERVDADPDCGDVLTTEDVGAICEFCTNRTFDNTTSDQWIMSRMSDFFITPDKLQGKNAPGWMCAQARPLYALYEVQKYYEATGTAFPDYFLLVDDDTYYHMPKYESYFGLNGAAKARAVAGCAIKFHILFRIPYGGFGFTLSRGLLELIMTPVNCGNSNIENTALNAEERLICTSVNRNGIGELPVFKDKMKQKGTLVELMKGYADQSPFRDFRNWTTGYCLHSDWATAYFLALLRNMDEQTTNIPFRVYNPRRGMRSIYPPKRGELSICSFVGKNCTVESEACHYVDEAIMTRVFRDHREQAPDDFGIPPTVVTLRHDGYDASAK